MRRVDAIDNHFELSVAVSDGSTLATGAEAPRPLLVEAFNPTNYAVIPLASI